MMVDLDVDVGTLLGQFPWAEEVFHWHQLEPEPPEYTLTLAGLCELRGRDPVRLLADLRAAGAWTGAPAPEWSER